MRQTICKPAASGPNCECHQKQQRKKERSTRDQQNESMGSQLLLRSRQRLLGQEEQRSTAISDDGAKWQRTQQKSKRERRGRRQRRREKKQCSVCSFIKEEERPAGCMVKTKNNNKSLRLCLFSFYDCKSGLFYYLRRVSKVNK